MKHDHEARHTIGNLAAERDACKRQLQAASAIVRALLSGEAGAPERAARWCEMIDRVIVVVE